MSDLFRKNYKLALMLELYLFGRKVAFSYRIRQTDFMLKVALLLLLEKQRQTVTELADRISATISTLSEKMRFLEDEGLVKKSTEGDARKRLLNITNHGEKTLEAIYNRLIASKLDQKIKLSEEEAGLLLSLLKKVEI